MATSREHPDWLVEISLRSKSMAFDEERASAKIGMPLAHCPYLTILEEDKRKDWIAGYFVVSSTEDDA